MAGVAQGFSNEFNPPQFDSVIVLAMYDDWWIYEILILLSLSSLLGSKTRHKRAEPNWKQFHLHAKCEPIRSNTWIICMHFSWAMRTCKFLNITSMVLYVHFRDQFTVSLFCCKMCTIPLNIIIIWNLYNRMNENNQDSRCRMARKNTNKMRTLIQSHQTQESKTRAPSKQSICLTICNYDSLVTANWGHMGVASGIRPRNQS